MTRQWLSIAVLTVSLVLGLPNGPAAAQKAPPADAATLAAARDLLEATGSAKAMDGMIEQMSKGFTQGAAQAGAGPEAEAAAAGFKASMAKFATYKTEMLNDMAALYATKFTAAEMKAVADFYRAGPGAKFIQKQPELMQEGGQIGMKYSQKIMEEMKQGAGQKK
jgi:uncharacterized protein